MLFSTTLSPHAPWSERVGCAPASSSSRRRSSGSATPRPRPGTGSRLAQIYSVRISFVFRYCVFACFVRFQMEYIREILGASCHAKASSCVNFECKLFVPQRRLQRSDGAMLLSLLLLLLLSRDRHNDGPAAMCAAVGGGGGGPAHLVAAAVLEGDRVELQAGRAELVRSPPRGC